MSGLYLRRRTRSSMHLWLPFPWAPSQQQEASPSLTLSLGSCRCPLHCMSLQSTCMHVHSRAQTLSKLVKVLPDEVAAGCLLPGCECAIAPTGYDSIVCAAGVLAYSNIHIPEEQQHALSFSMVIVSKLWKLHCAGDTAGGQESAGVGFPLAVQSILSH